MVSRDRRDDSGRYRLLTSNERVHSVDNMTAHSGKVDPARVGTDTAGHLAPDARRIYEEDHYATL